MIHIWFYYDCVVISYDFTMIVLSLYHEFTMMVPCVTMIVLGLYSTVTKILLELFCDCIAMLQWLVVGFNMMLIIIYDVLVWL